MTSPSRRTAAGLPCWHCQGSVLLKGDVYQCVQCGQISAYADRDSPYGNNQSILLNTPLTPAERSRAMRMAKTGAGWAEIGLALNRNPEVLMRALEQQRGEENIIINQHRQVNETMSTATQIEETNTTEPFGLSEAEAKTLFKSETETEKWLTEKRWPTGAFCPFCGSSTVEELNGTPLARECQECHGIFDVLTGTRLERIRLKMGTWMLGAYMTMRDFPRKPSVTNMNRTLKVSTTASKNIIETTTDALREEKNIYDNLKSQTAKRPPHPAEGQGQENPQLPTPKEEAERMQDRLSRHPEAQSRHAEAQSRHAEAQSSGAGAGTVGESPQKSAGYSSTPKPILGRIPDPTPQTQEHWGENGYQADGETTGVTDSPTEEAAEQQQPHPAETGTDVPDVREEITPPASLANRETGDENAPSNAAKTADDTTAANATTDPKESRTGAQGDPEGQQEPENTGHDTSRLYTAASAENCALEIRRAIEALEHEQAQIEQEIGEAREDLKTIDMAATIVRRWSGRTAPDTD